MGQYNKQVATAQRLIAKYGQAINWTVVEDGEPADATKPWKPSTAVETVKPVYIAFFTIDKEWQRTLMFLKDSLLPIGLTVGLMGAQSFVPTMKDYFVRSGSRKTLKSIDVLSPSGQNILYTIEFSD